MGAQVLRASQASGLKLLATATAAGVASVDITGLTSLYERYLLTLDNVVPSVDAQILVRTSTDGVSFSSGATDYAHSRVVGSSAGTATGAGSTGDSSVPLSLGFNVEATAAPGLSGHIWIVNPAGTTYAKHLLIEAACLNAPGNFVNGFIQGQRLSTAAITAIRILGSGANISGKFKLYGLAKQ